MQDPFPYFLKKTADSDAPQSFCMFPADFPTGTE